MDDLNERANDYEDGLHLRIDGLGFTSHFVISGDTEWTVDGNLLTLETPSESEFIDTDSIARIRIDE